MVFMRIYTTVSLQSPQQQAKKTLLYAKPPSLGGFIVGRGNVQDGTVIACK